MSPEVFGVTANRPEQDVNDLGHASSSVPREENLLFQLSEKVTGLPNLLTSVDIVIYTVHTLELPLQGWRNGSPVKGQLLQRNKI